MQKKNVDNQAAPPLPPSPWLPKMPLHAAVGASICSMFNINNRQMNCKHVYDEFDYFLRSTRALYDLI